MIEKKLNENKFKEIWKKIFSRYHILAVAFLTIGGLFIGQLFNLQIIEGENYEEMIQSTTLNSRVLKAARGNIVDRNGTVIAQNKKAYTVMYIKTELKSEEINEMFLNLNELLKKKGDTINRTLETFITIKPFKFQQMFQSYWPTKNDPEKIKKLKERVKFHLGVSFTDEEEINAEAVFRKLRDYYKIDENLSDTQAFDVMCMRFETRGASTTKPVTLATDVSMKTVAEIEERHHQFQGVSTDKIPIRDYKNAQDVCHVLGYYRDADATGVEKQYDEYLTGQDGRSRIEINEDGHLIERSDVDPPVAGSNLILTIDMKLQKKVNKILKNALSKVHSKKKAGSIVVMNPKNGEVLALVNNPSYDPEAFIKSNSSKKARKKMVKYLMSGEPSPLINRAIYSADSPGSTYKPVVGLAGLEEGKISLGNSIIYDPGYVNYDNVYKRCLERPGYGHGSLSLQTGLQTSCNIYFYKLGVMCGIDMVDKWAKRLGLGELTGIDLPNEASGKRANRENHAKQPNAGYWSRTYTAISSIGQYLNSFTPIQMCRYASTLAMDGEMPTPHVVQKVINSKGEVVLEGDTSTKQVGTNKEFFREIRRGMARVVTSGTAVGAFSGYKYKSQYPVAAKTGTIEKTNSRYDNAAFMCYAPLNNPEIAVFVYITDGGWGSNAGYAAKDVLNYYFAQKTKKGTEIENLREGPSALH